MVSHFPCSRTGATRTENVDGDAELLQLPRRHRALNRVWRVAEGERFTCCTGRVWSEGQQQWLGWERKRGKLHELNRLLRGSLDTRFIGLDSLAHHCRAQCLCRDAGCRYASAARIRATRLVDAGASSINRASMRPPAVLSRVCGVAATRDAFAAHRSRRIIVSAVFPA
jgi:cyclic beta-1,2-glucan synthetase